MSKPKYSQLKNIMVRQLQMLILSEKFDPLHYKFMMRGRQHLDLRKMLEDLLREQQMPNKMIIIEGTDGTGKTSLVKGLKKYLPNAHYVKFPTRIPKAHESHTERFWLDDMAKHLPLYGNVVVDRSFITTAVYQALIKRPKESPASILAKGERIFKRRNDEIFLIRLKCNPETCYNRISIRNDNRDEMDRMDRNNFIKKSMVINRGFDEAFDIMKGFGKYGEVDTTKMNELQTLKKVLMKTGIMSNFETLYDL